ncbi:conjugal transfer protein TraC [Candidatus Saccharibacteria bacterium]|nr:MAG: conjugal transfer protein TraC [Candidatus Saccharibacteria bacterium]
MGLFGKKKVDPVDVAQAQRLREQQEIEAEFLKGITTLRDLIAPSSLEIQSGYFRLGTKYGRTLYIYGYPRQIYTGWLSPVINIDEVIDVSMFVYPVESQVVLNNLRKKVGQLEASVSINAERGKVRDPGLEAAIRDAEELRDQIQVGAERFFRFGLYITMYADSLDELGFVQHKIETILGQQLVFSKVASSQQEQGLNSTVPQMADQLQIRRNMNTGAISSSFPFTSADLTQEKGILYGINMHNNGLVIFDRYSLENANMVVFAKSGAGKSFTVKLEALRSMMTGAEVIIIDPENEYQRLSDAVGGSYIRLSLNSETRINPFDLPRVIDADDADDALRTNLITLHGLLRLMLGGAQLMPNGTTMSALSPTEEADLDQALIDTYARAGITSDPLTHNSQPPTINDLYETLLHMNGSGPQLAQRLRKYTTGTFAGVFSQQSNIDINNPMVVFNIRDLEDELRPVAMYIILNHIWNKTRSDQRKRMLIVDEAWQLMKYEDSANFLFSLSKRARKYYLGLTTISQDVEDFMSSKMGRAIVANSSMQLLLKQSTSAVDVLADVFKLTEEEKKRLANFPVGQGLFFAGQNHVHIQVIASATEQQLITTNPQQVEALLNTVAPAAAQTANDLTPSAQQQLM